MTTKQYCGLDFHKNFTQICVLDAEGRVIEENRIRTDYLYSYLSNKNYVIALEASGGAFDAAAKLEALWTSSLTGKPFSVQGDWTQWKEK